MNWKDCRKNLQVVTNFTIANGTYDRLEFSGYFKVLKDLGDIEVRLEASKCSLDLKTCDRYPFPSDANACNVLQLKGKYYTEIIQSIEPTFQCPIKSGTYTINPLNFKFPAVLSRLPLSGYIWISSLKFVDKQSRNLVACFSFQVKFITKRIREKPQEK